MEAAFEPKITTNKNKAITRQLGYFDDTLNLLGLRQETLVVSFDDGATFQDVKETQGVTVIGIQFDNFNKKRAFAFTTEKTQYVTTDQGKSWSKFDLVSSDGKDAKLTTSNIPRVNVNADNQDLVLITVVDCEEGRHGHHTKCVNKHFVTKDGFKSNAKALPFDGDSCVFLRSTPHMSNKGFTETILCSQNTKNSFGHVVNSYLYSSSDFFKTKTKLTKGLTNKGIFVDVRIELGFCVAVTRSDKFNTKSKVSLLVSKDGIAFDEADLKIDIAYGIMTFLETLLPNLYVSVMDYSSEAHMFSLSTVWALDSSGLKFRKFNERISGEAILQVQQIEGSWIANFALDESDSDNDKNLLDLLIGGGLSADTKSRYSSNDGVDWVPLVVNDDSDCKVQDGCSLHVLSPTERDGRGKYVTGPTPGIVLAVGSKGTKLETNMDKLKTWVSRDGGATWNFGIDKPCLFSFGDQGNIIFAVPYLFGTEVSTEEYYYSLDQGKTWEMRKFGTPLFPVLVTTTIDGTSKKFVVSGLEDKDGLSPGEDLSEVLYAINFEGAFGGKKCSDNDFEKVYARVDQDNKPTCVHGYKTAFSRRKQDAQCFANKLFTDVVVEVDPCECTDIDFECGPGFTLSPKNECVPDPMQINIMCAESKVLVLKNKVLSDASKCVFGKKKLQDFVTNVELKCSDYKGHDAPGAGNDGSNDNSDNNNVGANLKIKTYLNRFEDQLSQYNYIEAGVGFGPENIIVRTENNNAYVSNNGGLSYNRVPVSNRIVAIYTGEVPGHVILITDIDVILVSYDGGNTFAKFKTPGRPSYQTAAVTFHKDNAEKFIWYTSEGCVNPLSSDCELTAYYTENGGRDFRELKKGVVSCFYVGSVLDSDKVEDVNTIFCQISKPERFYRLESSNNYFKDLKSVFENVVGMALTGKYFVVATVDTEKNALRAKVSVDGTVFADADFPHDFVVDAQLAYTILQSPTGSVFTHVTTNSEDGFEMGALLKSNSNGTFYVLSLDKVNRNHAGYVDYDRIEGLEGVIVANSVYLESGLKKLKTQISHNDGGEWSFLRPPQTDLDGKKYSCTGSSLEKCSLNLHGFTERADYRDVFSSASAVGLMIGVGNVGETLEPYSKASTFLTRDGGMSWKEVKKGVYMWEYGDRGTILVLVNAKDQTNSLSYSLDEGASWTDYQFSEKPVSVIDLATVPSDTARKFVIFAYDSKNRKETLSFAIDFSDVHQRQCQLDLENPDKDDYEFWTPSHPNLPDDCLFGHEAMYLRRAVGHDDCFIGEAPLKEGFKITKNCTCTRRDYECDYNYYRDSDNTCKLVKGLSPADRQNDYCGKPDAFQYFESTGYRKLPLSTCVGGKEFDSWKPKPCPGKQSEFNKHYGQDVSGGELTAIIIVPILVFIIATWFVYDRGIRRNGGFKRLGQIRLDADEDDFQPIENNQVDKVVNTIVRGGIFVAAGLFATFKTIRKLDSMLFEKVTSAIFRRSPGRRNYVLVPELDEEEELFGNFQDNYDDELEEGARTLNTSFRDEEPNADLGETPVEPTDNEADLFNINDQSDEESTR